jgi:putative FmdB family regulatory protein
MPIYEALCERCNVKTEWYAKSRTDENKPCRCCGGETRRLASAFGVIWTGAITPKYTDHNKPDSAGPHWAYRVRSSKSGNPEPVLIDTWAKQKQFCKEEGLVVPSDLPSNAEVSADGKKLQSAGMSGQWI